ncbi:MAG: hypothetical protein JAY91_11105, partial [Candidatus Thiodiazotropha endolucinida]|nr:hypothetical protein [Candidatus Thiodiazotropha taylori]MCW4241430.1 hypothetical protein [Candidatus Thiodiazotropha taylori]
IGPSMAAMLLDRYSWFPISRDQIRMLTKGNICRGDEIFNLCGIEPKSFSPDHLQYLLNKPTTGEDKTASAY